MRHPAGAAVVDDGPPALFFLAVLARLDPADLGGGVARLREAWEDVFAGQEPHVQFLDESFAGLYRDEERWGRAFAFASAFAIGIACMGLLGLVALAVTRRTREIGIRRVLGAHLGNLLSLLSGEFAWLVLIGNGVAFPVAWIGARRWLETFAFRTGPDPLLFVLAALGLLAIALLTMAGHVLHAASARPAEALRSE